MPSRSAPARLLAIVVLVPAMFSPPLSLPEPLAAVARCAHLATDCRGLALLGPAGRCLLGLGGAGGQRAVGCFQVRADEPVELFELRRLRDEHVLGDQVEVLGG